MSKILVGVVVLAALGFAGWWFGVKRPAEFAEAQHARQTAADAERRAQRETLFGAEALAPEVQWRDSGLGYRIIAEGTGPKAGIGTKVKLSYVGRLKDGTVFDRSPAPMEFRIGEMVAGMSAAAQMLGAGGKGVFFLPPRLGYGAQAVAGIPANSALIFEVEVVAVNP